MCAYSCQEAAKEYGLPNNSRNKRENIGGRKPVAGHSRSFCGLSAVFKPQVRCVAMEKIPGKESQGRPRTQNVYIEKKREDNSRRIISDREIKPIKYLRCMIIVKRSLNF